MISITMFCSGVRLSEISLPYCLLLMGLDPMWSVQVDGSNRGALHMPRIGVSFTVISLAYFLVFLRKVNLTIFCVFWCNYVVLAFVVPYVYLNVNVEDAISQEGGVCYGFKFDRNIRDGSGFILFALAPPEVLFASVARCLNRHCARHAAPNRMQWHQWPRTLIKSGLALRVADWSHDIMLVAFSR